MHTASTSLRRIAGLLGLGAALSIPVSLSVAADAPTNADAFPSYESYIKVTGQTAWISGDDASYAARQSTPTWGSFGIEDFNFYEGPQRRHDPHGQRPRARRDGRLPGHP